MHTEIVQALIGLAAVGVVKGLFRNSDNKNTLNRNMLCKIEIAAPHISSTNKSLSLQPFRSFTPI